jgi:hypothetical protein
MTSRRTFLETSVLAATAAGLARRARAAPSDRVRVGFIGVGNRGDQLLDAFAAQPDVEIAALCDVYEPYLQRDAAAIHPRYKAMGRVPRMKTAVAASVPRERDFRRLLDRKDVDAVCIATPDHWHAVQAILAMDAGKDVYVEKPLTITLVEGRRMVEAQKRTGRVVEVGLHRRASASYRKLAGLVRDGLIGKVTLARAYRVDNMAPSGIGREKPEDPRKFQLAVPQAFAGVVLQMLAKRPEDRYQSMAEVQRDLRLIDGKTLLGRWPAPEFLTGLLVVLGNYLDLSVLPPFRVVLSRQTV